MSDISPPAEPAPQSSPAAEPPSGEGSRHAAARATKLPLTPRSSRPSVPTGVRVVAVLLAVLVLRPQPVVLPLVSAFREAQTAVTGRDFDAAADALAESAARLPYSSDTLWQAALAELAAGRYAEAARHIHAAAAVDGWTAERQIALGDAYLGLNQPEAAVTQWEQVLAARPGDDGLLARLANSYEAAGRLADARRMLSDLVKLRPDDRSAHYRLALVTAATMPDEALAPLATVLAIAPELGAPIESLMDAIEGGRSAGDPAFTFGRVGFALAQLQEWRLAEAALGQAVALNSGYGDAFAYLGLAQDMQGKDGLPALQTALKLAPGSPLVQYLLGLHYRRAGDSQTALEYLRAAQALDPENPAIAAEVGGAYASMGDLPNAEVWLTQAVNANEQSAEFWLLLARFYVDNDYHIAELGVPAARMASSLAPDSALATDTLGFALVLSGDLVNGEKVLERALALDPEEASIVYHLGILYMRQGRPVEADAALNRALTLDPDGPVGGLALRALAQLHP